MARGAGLSVQRVCLEDRLAEVRLLMLFKAAIMGVPVVGSRTSPTNLALAVAERLNSTVCGYLRQGSRNVDTHPWRMAA